ncbi:uncharacterized protein LOC106005945 [Mustela putorius furo]|uniref:Uncharacterized protein LOC106005945 n=1 Tax=Mustela putorius furo TaxID=9669 RepID=A0A8U0UXT0_MUSPF|nr:uncharacterized protein LOC106005945 [Mustela putorius furo]
MPQQQAGGLEEDGGKRIRICEHVYEEGEKMCVNCMMKRKSLVLNEKAESGPEPAEALGVPGVCGERLEEVRGPRRDAGDGRPVPRRADHHFREKAGAAPGFKETDMRSQQRPLSRICKSSGSMWLCPRPLLPGVQRLHPAAPGCAWQQFDVHQRGRADGQSWATTGTWQWPSNTDQPQEPGAPRIEGPQCPVSRQASFRTGRRGPHSHAHNPSEEPAASADHAGKCWVPDSVPRRAELHLKSRTCGSEDGRHLLGTPDQGGPFVGASRNQWPPWRSRSPVHSAEKENSWAHPGNAVSSSLQQPGDSEAGV